MSWKKLDRRKFLYGSGALIGLPLLEAMLPFRKALAQPAPVPLRTIIVNWQFGAYKDQLMPAGSGTNYTFPSQHSALAPFKASITPIKRVFNYWGNVDGAGDHARGQGTYLTQVRLNKSETTIRAGISMDQVIANALTGKTRVKSAYFSGDRGFYGDSGYSGTYKNISWQSATTPNTRLGDPHQVFDALLAGVATTPGNNAATLARLKKRKSILDGAVTDANRLMASLGTTDREKLDQFLTSAREVETRIAADIQDQNMQAAVCSPGTRPPTNQNFQTRTRLFFDLIVLAAQCDSTRVFAYHMGSPGDFGPIIGVAGDHHNDYSHHQESPTAIDGLMKIAKWYADQFAYFIGKMNSILDANGKSLLYNSIITYGAEMRDTNAHDDYNIPLLVAGHAGGLYSPGRLIDPGANLPMANVWLTIMKTMGVNINSFGEGGAQSTGTIQL
ncbi:MAG: DUF1552 domain-containing protein [Bdellovibrionales bacterium]